MDRDPDDHLRVPVLVRLALVHPRRHAAEQGGRDRRARAAVDWTVHARERRHRLRSPHPRGRAGPARDDVEGRAPQLLRAGDAREAGRRAAPLHVRVVRGDQAGHVPPDLRRVLRHEPRPDVVPEARSGQRSLRSPRGRRRPQGPRGVRALPERQGHRPDEHAAGRARQDALRQEGLLVVSHRRR